MKSRQRCWALLPLLWAGISVAAPFEVLRSQESSEHPRLVLAPREGARTATLVVLFSTGRFDEGGDTGLTRLSQHALLEANLRGDYGKLTRELFGADASLELFTGLRQSGFVLESNSGDFDRLARQLLETLLAPKLIPSRLEATAERTTQDPGLTSSEDFLETRLAIALSDDPRYAAAPPGNPSSAQSISPETVERHLAGAFSPRNATVIAAGTFDAVALRRTLARFKGGIPSPVARLQIQLPVKRQLPAHSDVNVLAFPVKLTTASESAALRVVGPMLRRRMEQRFRTMGVGYAQDASPLLTPWMDALVLTLPASDPSALDLGPYLLQEVAEVREGRVTADEFAAAQGAALTRLRLEDQHPRAVALTLAGSLQTPAWYSAEVEHSLSSLSPEGLARLVEPWLREDRLVHLLFSPRALSPPPRKTFNNAGTRSRRR
ncbi:insulinase family protein [Myxococcus llanfairpwllgwyngyllgogerychwyrndrobwllllantysiliogogogochensis]|uniref:Insulinase family protein n=1 Tax=Myxococcus llanfairpwllgwyngyllgogerychwyrndrobwllllantysiliogogogochensis TaxID=2590453 RepID=A0A540X4H5_9BACT|nr:insulinase family protein [Myxococcus llanfairpwllgwyngyllgogerychwyrndrobwllllantysiliogogogochensis]TQF16155.1 insulinase family protein [Myxococcus llanfairpwllgwyngyllgogerychwyrndrobwllllantysiliogogogochensis]